MAHRTDPRHQTDWDACALSQIGHIRRPRAQDTGLPLTEGLVLSSAYASNLSCETFEDVPFGSGVSGDQDLVDIANSVPGMIGQNFNVSSANDLCILEFDFVATGDTVKFNYIFGSDEYLEWVNSSFNDIFAFFLSMEPLAATRPISCPRMGRLLRKRILPRVVAMKARTNL